MKAEGSFQEIKLFKYCKLVYTTCKAGKLPAQGYTLSKCGVLPTPCKGKSMKDMVRLLPFQGEPNRILVPRAMPWAISFLPLWGAIQ